MAHLAPLSDESYKYIAQKVAPFLYSFGIKGEFLLGEGFPIWSMTPNNYEFNTFYPTGDWHFQIATSTSDGQHARPIGYARAKIYGQRNTDWEVNGYFDSRPISNRINDALTLADRYPDLPSGEGRLLIAPFYKLISLWVHERYENDIFIPVSPSVIDRESPIVTFREVLSAQGLFNRLRKSSLIIGRSRTDEANEIP